MDGNTLLVIKDGLTYDVSGLVQSIKWSGRRDSAARSLRVCLLDEDNSTHERIGIALEEGQRCVFFRDGRELFRGMFMRSEQSRRRLMTLNAYDAGIYLSNNADSFYYSGRTASFIFRDVCTRFNIPFGAVDETLYIIDELPKAKTTGYDVICDALSRTYEATGKRFIAVCEGDRLRLMRRRNNVLQWVIERGANISDYSYSQDIEKIRTRVKLLNRHDETVAFRSAGDIEARLGVFQTVLSAPNDLSPGKLKLLAASILREGSRAKRTLSIEAVGRPEIITGLGVFIKIPHLSLEKSFYVESDTHVFEGSRHMMSLTLSDITDFDIEDDV